MNKQILVLLLLCWVLNVHSQDKSTQQSDAITTERLAEIINASFTQNPKESGVKQIDIYVLLDSGVYYYNSKSKMLESYMIDNYKAKLGNENMVVGVIYVAHAISSKKDYNITYLYGCSIANSVLRNIQNDNFTIISREKVDKDQLSTLLKLQDDDKIIISQIFGHR